MENELLKRLIAIIARFDQGILDAPGDIGIDKWGNKDLHTVTVTAFQNIFYTAFYIISMLMLAFHLSHGVGSAFQTLGLNTSKYEKTINFAGKCIAVLIPLIFASIPIALYVR